MKSTANHIFNQLKILGTAQNRKVWAKHGAPKNHFGVSFAHLEKFKKQLLKEYQDDPDTRHSIALQLWKTGNCDAQILASMIADPTHITLSEARDMMNNTSFYLISNYLGGLFARTSFAIELMEEEMLSNEEFTKHNGYDIFSTILKNNKPKISKAKCLKYLRVIEEEIHDSPNRAKNAMNAALISLGVYRHDIRKNVISVAKRIGKVEVDHGDTNCKTPNAINYIEKCINRESK